MLDGDQRAQLGARGYRIELFLAALGEFIELIDDSLALLGQRADILVAIGGRSRAADHEWDQGRDSKRGFTQGANAPMWHHDASLYSDVSMCWPNLLPRTLNYRSRVLPR